MSDTAVHLGDTRVAGTVDLMQLYVDGKKRGDAYNVPDGVASNLDPAGNHAFSVVAVNDGRYRVSVIVKVRDSARPFCALMDVDPTQWVKLYTMFETRTMTVDAERRLKLPPRLVPEMEEVK